MTNLLKNSVFKIVLISVLVVSIVLVVVLGRAKLNGETKKWKAVLSEIETRQKNTDNLQTTNAQNPGNDNKEKPTKTYEYRGAEEIGASNNNRWSSKNWYALGDNITAGNGYQNRVKSALNISNVNTDAAIGKVMADMAININSEKLKDVDLVTIFGGTSDYSLDTSLGTINDDESSNTFYGSIHKTIKKIIDANPEATIVFFTPLKRGAYKTYPVYPAPNKAGVKLENYVQAIKDVCKTYNILVYDLFNESGINESNLKSYTTDNLNLNITGYIRISTQITNYLKTIK